MSTLSEVYYLVEFIGEAVEDAERSTDCVPVQWMKYDFTSGQLVTKFMPPPYNKKRSNQLEKMVKECADAPDDWPQYAVSIRGRAATYDEAERRLSRLRTEEYAYTTEGENPKEKVELSTKSFVDKARKDDRIIDKMMKMPRLSNPITDTLSVSSEDQPYEPSGDSSENTGSTHSTDENDNVVRTSLLHKGKAKKTGPIKLPGSTKKSKTSSRYEVKTAKSSVTPSAQHRPIKPARPLLSKETNNEEFTQKSAVPSSASLTSKKLVKDSAKDPMRAQGNPAYMLTSKPCTSNTDNGIELLTSKIEKLCFEHRDLVQSVNELKASLEEVLKSEVLGRKRESFEQKYKLDIPLTTDEEFIDFDEMLASDQQCHNDFVSALTLKYELKKSVSKNLCTILKKYVTRDVALLYTAQKSVGGKKLFKKTEFSNCVLETIDRLAEEKMISTVSDREYLVHLGTVLSNAKDWGVTRKRPVKPIDGEPT